MLLHTPFYLLFLAVVVTAYWALPRHNWRKWLLLLASYLFYALFDYRFALLLFGLTAVVYFLGRAIAAARRPRLYYWIGVAINLGLLGLFKYADFFLGSVQTALTAVGIRSLSPALRLLLPVGISFYTFQAIAYLTEIHRKPAESAAGFVDFALYLAFFPKLIAGPLARPRQFLADLAESVRPLSRERLGSALGLLLLGLFKKLLIADSLGVLAEVAFRAAEWPAGKFSFAAPLFLQGFYLYAFQIYADFSGYTDMARASAALLGFSLPENFRQPYLAATVTDFWNRWHMTLTQWFREHLFFPLSRTLLVRLDRKYAAWMPIAANLVTMALVGLWHGAAWTFVAWGLWHGVLLSMERLLQFKSTGRWQQIATGILTFHLVGLGWILFRASSFAGAARFIVGLFSFQQLNWLGHYLPSILLTAGLVFAIDLGLADKLPIPAQFSQRWKPVLVVAAIVACLGLTLLSFVRGVDARPFIYGQF